MANSRAVGGLGGGAGYGAHIHEDLPEPPYWLALSLVQSFQTEATVRRLSAIASSGPGLSESQRHTLFFGLLFVGDGRLQRRGRMACAIQTSRWWKANQVPDSRSSGDRAAFGCLGFRRSRPGRIRGRRQDPFVIIRSVRLTQGFVPSLSEGLFFSNGPRHSVVIQGLNR